MEKERILNDKILSNDILTDIKQIISDLEFIELEIYSLQNKNKDIHIFDRNDIERQMLVIEEGFNNKNGFDSNYLDDSFNKVIIENDLRILVENYLQLLLRLAVIIDISIQKLEFKTSELYKNYFKTKAHKALNIESTDFKYGDYDNYLEIKNNFSNLNNACENNPYKIILNVYKHYLDIIYIKDQNLKLESDNIYRQVEIIREGLKLDISTFNSLKKWEDSIEVKEFIGLYDLLKK